MNKAEESYRAFAEETALATVSTRDAFMAGWNACISTHWTLPPDERPQLVKDVGGVTPEMIYEAYPRKVGRHAALTSISRAYLRLHSAKGGTPESCWKELLESTKEYAKATSAWPVEDKRFIPHPATWYNQDRFMDDRKEWVRQQPQGAKSNGIRVV